MKDFESPDQTIRDLERSLGGTSPNPDLVKLRARSGLRLTASEFLTLRTLEPDASTAYLQQSASWLDSARLSLVQLCEEALAPTNDNLDWLGGLHRIWPEASLRVSVACARSAGSGLETQEMAIFRSCLASAEAAITDPSVRSTARAQANAASWESTPEEVWHAAESAMNAAFATAAEDSEEQLEFVQLAVAAASKTIGSVGIRTAVDREVLPWALSLLLEDTEV